MDLANPTERVPAVLVDAAGEAADPPSAGSQVPHRPVARILGGASAVVVLYDITRKATLDVAVSHVSLCCGSSKRKPSLADILGTLRATGVVCCEALALFSTATVVLPARCRSCSQRPGPSPRLRF